MGDFTAELSNNFADSFFGSSSLKSLIKKPLRFKNPDNPTSISLILTNRQKSFQNFIDIETWLSDFQSLLLLKVKSYLKKLEPKKLIYLDFKNFSNQQFRTELLKELSENNVDAGQLHLFQTIFLRLFNKLAPSKQKTLRNNQSSFINRGDTHMTSTLRGVGGKTKIRCYRTKGGRGEGVSECSGRLIFIFFH